MAHLKIDGCNIYFEWLGGRGPTPPVIFLHDGLGSTASWKGIPEVLASELHVAALNYDRQGYGRSCTIPQFQEGFLEREAEFLARLMDAFEIEQAHLVGHSDGATIALLFAASRADRTLSVTAEAPHTFVEEETHEGLSLLVEKERSGELHWLQEQHGERAAELLRNWVAVWLRQHSSKWDIRGCLEWIEAPVLVIQGDTDEYATLAQVSEIEQRIANAQSWVLPGCGHAPHANKPEVFLEQTISHIRKAMEVQQHRFIGPLGSPGS